jgi:transposase
LNKIDREVTDDLDVHVILDNLSTHKTPAVREWLLRHSRFHFHFTPTYGSWMNLVERWFSALTTKTLQRSAHRSVQALAQDIRDWVETWNDNPRPLPGTRAPRRSTTDSPATAAPSTNSERSNLTGH